MAITYIRRPIFERHQVWSVALMIRRHIWNVHALFMKSTNISFSRDRFISFLISIYDMIAPENWQCYRSEKEISAEWVGPTRRPNGGWRSTSIQGHPSQLWYSTLGTQGSWTGGNNLGYGEDRVQGTVLTCRRREDSSVRPGAPSSQSFYQETFGSPWLWLAQDPCMQTRFPPWMLTNVSVENGRIRSIKKEERRG